MPTNQRGIIENSNAIVDCGIFPCRIQSNNEIIDLQHFKMYYKDIMTVFTMELGRECRVNHQKAGTRPKTATRDLSTAL
jgi:hypothetical protein